MIGLLLAAVIELTGVTGSDLRSRAFFDINNVKVGDPLVLTIDFIGEADFSNLHPPTLAKLLDRRDWKLDDRSAKTDTYKDARRLTYRVRPMREGVLWFPELEFAFATADGRKTVKTNRIPVHAKAGAQVVVDGMSEADEKGYPKPPELIRTLSRPLSGDDDFAWRKALAKPSADGFAAFDFPEARMNEATMAICEGNSARAIKIYQLLEWRIGQTPEIERGLLAALAVKYENPNPQLPIWRTLLRPILKYDWRGRVGIAVGAFAVVALFFWLIGRGLKAVAAIGLMALVLAPQSGFSQGLFEQMEQHMQQMQQRMNQMMGGGGFSSFFGEREPMPVPQIGVAVSLSKPHPEVGENFEFIISLDAPKSCSLNQIRISLSETFGMTETGQCRFVGEAKSANASNKVARISMPVRYDVPFDGKVTFSIDGMVTGRRETTIRGYKRAYSYSNSFNSKSDPVAVMIRPLSGANQPKDFAGIISEDLRLHEYCDLLKVGTNDVITITYRMQAKGFVPKNFLLPNAAFEWGRSEPRNDRVFEIEYRAYLVTDGVSATPKISIPYYDPRAKSYRRAECGGTKLTYTAE